MTTTTTNPLIAAGLATLDFARRTTNMFLDTIDESKSMERAAPNSNHTRWIVGHLALTDDMFLVKLGEKERALPEEWDALFGYKSVVSDDASKYPPLADLRKAMDERRTAVCDWFSNLSDEELARPLPEDWQTFAPTIGAVAGSMAAHECMHNGQLTAIRRHLGLEPCF